MVECRAGWIACITCLGRQLLLASQLTSQHTYMNGEQIAQYSVIGLELRTGFI